MAASSPMELPYMRVLRAALRSLGSWPAGTAGAAGAAGAHHWLLFVLWSAVILLQILYIRRNISELSMFELGHIAFIVLAFCVVSQRVTLVSTKSFGVVTNMFITEIHLFHHKHKSDYAMKVCTQIDRLCYIFCCLATVAVGSDPFVSNAAPIANNYRTGMYAPRRARNHTYQFSVYYELPFDYETEFIGYLLVSLFNCAVTFIGAVCWFCFDLYLSVIVFHTWGHLKILDHNLRNFPRPKMRAEEGGYQNTSLLWYTPEESRKVAQLLKEHVDHHRMVMDFVRKTSDAFGLMVCVYYGFHQACDCILLLEMSSVDRTTIGEYGVLAVFAIESLVQMSIVFELISLKSDTLGDAVYSVPWECMRPRERRAVLMFLRNVQTPIALKALGVVPVGVQTMAAIFKTSISYFLMLRTINNK